MSTKRPTLQIPKYTPALLGVEHDWHNVKIVLYLIFVLTTNNGRIKTYNIFNLTKK